MKLLFDFDPVRCTACGACAVACMDQNDIDVENGQEPYRRVYLKEEAERGTLYISAACLHCDDAPCIPACPMKCLTKDEETGLTVLDNTNCIGCRACARACPYNAPTFRPTGLKRPKVKMEKCHGCIERIKSGRKPACVHACPTRALNWHWAEAGETSVLPELLKK